MRHLIRTCAVLSCVLALGTVARAQTYPDVAPRALPAMAAPALTVLEPFAKAGPTIVITDNRGVLFDVTLGTYAVRRIGSEGVVLTDLGFDPRNHLLYGISFTELYRVDPKTARAVPIGSLGISDANALVFDAAGKAYVAGFSRPELYTLNLANGRAVAIGPTTPYKSAGDLTFYNGLLVLAGYTGSLGSSTRETLAALNPKTGKVTAIAPTDVVQLYGLVSTGKNLLFGFAKTAIYQLFPSQSVVSKRAVLLRNLSRAGVGDIDGAAYDGYFQR